MAGRGQQERGLLRGCLSQGVGLLPLLFREGTQLGSLGCLSQGVGLPAEKGPSWAHWGVPDSRKVLLAAACLSGPLILGGGVQAGNICTLSLRPTPSMDSRGPVPPPPLGPMRVTQSSSSEAPQPLCSCSWDHLRAMEGGDWSYVRMWEGQVDSDPSGHKCFSSATPPPPFRPLRSRRVSGRERTTIPCVREEVWSHKADTEPAVLPHVPAFPSQPQGLS